MGAHRASTAPALPETGPDTPPPEPDSGRPRILYVSWAESCSRSDHTARELGGRSHMIYLPRLGSHASTVALKYAGQWIMTARLLARERPDVVFVMSPPLFAALPAFWYAWRHGKQVVIDAHTGAFLFSRWRHFQWLQGVLCRHAATTLVTSEHLASLVRDAGGHATLVPDVPVLYEDREPFARPPGFAVAVICSFDRDEPVPVVFEAASRLPDVRFFVTGNPRSLPPEIASAIPANVTMTGFLSTSAYAGLLASADVALVLTTYNHTMLRGAYEAIYQGTPVIVSDWPILRDAFPQGAVHVDNSADRIVDAVRAVQRDRTSYRDGARRLREAKLARWESTRRAIVARIGGASAQPEATAPAGAPVRTASVTRIRPAGSPDTAAPPDPPAAPGPRGLMGYSDAVADDILRFQHEVFPHRRSDWVAPRWTWMFLASAARLAVAPMVWVFRARQGVVAHQGAIPVKVKIGDGERLTGWFVETAALESCRGKAIGPMVISKAREDLPFNLSLGQTPQMRAIQFALGWREVCPLGTYLFVLNAPRVLQHRIRNRWLRAGGAWMLSLWQRARHWRGRRRLSWAPEAVEIARFDERHTRLWHQVKGAYPCAVVRDASYLNWKYVDQPGQDFIRLEVRRGADVIAILVLALIAPSEGRAYRRGAIVDAVLPPSDGEAVWAALEIAGRTLRRRGADLMAFDLTSVPLSRAVRSFGFFASTPSRVFLVSTAGLPPEDQAAVLSGENWLLTGGDSDVDRPW